MGASVEVLVRVTGCVGAETGVEWNTEWMSFLVLGFHRSDFVTTNVQIELTGTGHC
jgi:hypothetical protein